MNEKICYNFGGGPKRVEGYKNVDMLDWNGATDILWDLTKTPYEFVNEQVDEILAIEFLEHISWRDTDRILAEWYRILKYKGKVSIQVPDCGAMMEMFIKREICQCCSHKPMSFEEKAVATVFTLTALAWVFRQDINLGWVIVPGWS